MLSKPSAPLRLHHLPLLMDVIRQIRLLNVIRTVVTDDPRSKVTTGDCLAVMLCAIYSSAHDLYGVRERLNRFDMATIMQDPEFSIDEFPEERLAKAMDDIWKAGPENLIFAIASQVIAAFRLDTSYFHYDTTSLTCYGGYDSEDDERSGGASVRCFPSELWPSPVRQGIGDHETPCSAFNMELYFGAVFIPDVQTHTFANHAVRSHPDAHASRADRGIVARATAGMLPSQSPG